MFINPSGLTVIVEETATSMAFRNGLRRRPARVHRRVGSLRGKLYFGNWRPSAAGTGRNLGSLSLRKLRKQSARAEIWDGCLCEIGAKQLRWHELIPIWSWIVQTGTCRYCGARIGWAVLC